VPTLLADAQTLCDADYINNPSVITSGTGLRSLIYPGGTSRFEVFDGTVVECRSTAGETVITLSSQARDVMFEVLADSPNAI
jgi:hypothetical protein